MMREMIKDNVKVNVKEWCMLNRFSGEIYICEKKDDLIPIIVDLTNCGYFCEVTVVKEEEVEDFLKEYPITLREQELPGLPATGWKWMA